MGEPTHVRVVRGGTGDHVDEALDRLAPRWAGWWRGLDVAAEAGAVRRRSADAVRAWGLTGLTPMPGGNVALVVAGLRHGHEVVLKVSPRGALGDVEVAAEARAMEHWLRSGVAAELLDQRDGGATMLLARVRPGLTLDEAGVGSAERLQVLAALAARLHAEGPPPARLPTMHDSMAPARRTLLAAGVDVSELDALTAPGAAAVVVHGDLHGGNVLGDGSGWRVIDPKGARGDRHADVWGLIDPLVPALPGDAASARRVARERVEAYASSAGMESGRAAAWTRLRARAAALAVGYDPAPSADDLAWAARLHRTADALG